jgi:adenylate cyclase
VSAGAQSLKTAKLIGEWDGRRQEFVLGRVTNIGRHPANHLRVSDREVSKEHARIEQVEGGYVLRDLNSSNGTFINGRRVGELKLKDGDQIGLGAVTVTFSVVDAPAGAGMGIPAVSMPGVTVVGSAQSMPAILAQIAQVTTSSEFRPVEELHDVAALKQDYEKLRIAHEFHRQVGAERDPKALWDKILNVAFELLAADNGVLFLTNEKKQLVPQAVKRRKTDSSEDVMLSETVLQKVMETRQAVLTADAILDKRFSSSESIVAQGIRSAMAVPLLTKDELIGVLFLDTRVRTNAFSEKDLKILSAIAAQAAIAIHNTELGRQVEKDAVARAELSRFLSPAVADMVVKGQVELLRQARLAEVSVLFADIRGFTALSERESPQEVVAMLNTFFTAMAAVVFRHEGNLDKFIGDCVMAVWGPPSPHPDDPTRAVQAALEMQEEVALLNQRREAEGKAPIAVGIGINTGQAVVGYMGSSERHEFTAIGDSVNTASRMCGLAKAGEVFATEATVKQLQGPGFDVEQLPASMVKGKEKPVSTFRVYRRDITLSVRGGTS